MKTIPVLLEEYASGDAWGGHWYYDSKEYEWETYQELSRRALGFTEELMNVCSVYGRPVIIISSSLKFNVSAFYGVISGGGKPLILPSMKSFQDKNTWLKRLLKVCRILLDCIIITEDSAHIINSSLGLCEQCVVICTSDLDIVEILSCTSKNNSVILSDDIAFLQMTSGSTGDGKLIVVGHKNVIINTHGIREITNCSDHEIGVSWLPLYHDMGLVGVELFCFINDYRVALLPSQAFLRRPQQWLRAISNFKCTMAVTPSFGLEYCVNSISDSNIDNYDLSSIKTLFCGAEPIRPTTVHEFTSKLKYSGYDSNSFVPCYGMAETTLAVTVRDIRKQISVLYVNKSSVSIGNKANYVRNVTECEGDKNTYLELISVGHAIAGTNISIVDQYDNKQEDGVFGEILVEGDSVTLGYIFNNVLNIIPYNNNKVHTGDIGIIINNELYVVDRIKNIIVYNGVNYSSAELESQAATKIGIAVDKCSVFESSITGDGSELLLMVEGGANMHLPQNILFAVKTIYPPLSRIIITSKRAMPRTTSGKKRYFECRALLDAKKIKVLENIDLSTVNA